MQLSVDQGWNPLNLGLVSQRWFRTQPVTSKAAIYWSILLRWILINRRAVSITSPKLLRLMPFPTSLWAAVFDTPLMWETGDAHWGGSFVSEKDPKAAFSMGSVTGHPRAAIFSLIDIRRWAFKLYTTVEVIRVNLPSSQAQKKKHIEINHQIINKKLKKYQVLTLTWQENMNLVCMYVYYYSLLIYSKFAFMLSLSRCQVTRERSHQWPWWIACAGTGRRSAHLGGHLGALEDALPASLSGWELCLPQKRNPELSQTNCKAKRTWSIAELHLLQVQPKMMEASLLCNRSSSQAKMQGACIYNYFINQLILNDKCIYATYKDIKIKGLRFVDLPFNI